MPQSHFIPYHPPFTFCCPQPLSFAHLRINKKGFCDRVPLGFGSLVFFAHLCGFTAKSCENGASPLFACLPKQPPDDGEVFFPPPLPLAICSNLAYVQVLPPPEVVFDTQCSLSSLALPPWSSPRRGDVVTFFWPSSIPCHPCSPFSPHYS